MHSSEETNGSFFVSANRFKGQKIEIIMGLILFMPFFSGCRDGIPGMEPRTFSTSILFPGILLQMVF